MTRRLRTGRAGGALGTRPLFYGGKRFTSATDLATRMSRAGRVRGLVGALLKRPGSVWAVVDVLRLPVVEVAVPAEDALAWQADFPPATGKIFGGWRAQAVLDLEADDASYLSGRRRQALRTNLGHARASGLRAERMPTYDEWIVAATTVLLHRQGGREVAAQMAPPGPRCRVRYYVARDAQGVAVAFAGVVGFGDCAVLFVLLSTPGHPSASSSRYLLHTFVRSDVRSAGYRHLIVGSAIRLAAGQQYFQHLLGYEVRNLRLLVDLTVEEPTALARR